MGVKENGGSGRLSRPPEWRDFIMKRFLSLVLAMLIAIVIPIILTSVVYQRKHRQGTLQIV